MLYPGSLAADTAVFHRGEVTLAREVGKPIGRCFCKRVVCAGGHSFDAPLSAPLRVPQSLTVERLRSGIALHAPSSQPCPSRSKISYGYTAPDNTGAHHVHSGTFYPTTEQAELLGWLVGDGTIHAKNQSIRFANSDVWVLQHVRDLVARAFPTVTIKFYAKNIGYDMLLTGGINNPLRAFLCKQRFVDEWPTTVSLFAERERIAFLRGLWGSDGWCSVRKGGNDVAMGLSRRNLDGFTSQCRMFHAFMGMNAQRRDTPTETYPNRHRLVFSGYRNYTTFYNTVGEIRFQHLEAPPVRKEKPKPKDMIVQGVLAHEARIIKVLRLRTKKECYEVTHA